ncbi:MAG: hypothetical protein H8E25_09270 [Planctomycetes bacterium]|nr:hypothetical protein [Planctomycetota bacterium]
MTLLEIMIALLLLGMLSTFVINVVDSVVGLWQQGERRGRGDLVYANVAERLQSDLRATHLGERGWFIIDDYVARPATDDAAEWRLPRLRFLAQGSNLLPQDLNGTRAVEIMWIAIPEKTLGTRFAKLLRVAQFEEVSSSLRKSETALAAARGENSTTIIDGVLDLKFLVGTSANSFLSEANSQINFPPSIEMQVERVSGNARHKPPRLDVAIAQENTPAILRGVAPLKMPPMALIEDEWVGVGGSFPRISLVSRAQRSTIASAHDASSFMYFPSNYSSRHTLLNYGRRAVR